MNECRNKVLILELLESRGKIKQTKHIKFLQWLILITIKVLHKVLKVVVFSKIRVHNPDIYYFSESMRLYPVLPMLTRISRADYTIPGTDIVLDKGTFVVVPSYGIHRDPEFYPEPLKFDPERFSIENRGKIPSTAHLAFGDGPRICVGEYFKFTIHN